MRSDSAYAIFIGFGIIWVAIGIAAVVALLKADNQPIRFGKWGLLVAIPSFLPILIALIVGAILSRQM